MKERAAEDSLAELRPVVRTGPVQHRGAPDVLDFGDSRAECHLSVVACSSNRRVQFRLYSSTDTTFRPDRGQSRRYTARLLGPLTEQ
jgi:hypothetical protein